MPSLRKQIDEQTTIEEFLNVFSHALGILLGITAIVVLSVYAAEKDDPTVIISCVIYGISLTLMFISSTLYHGIRLHHLRRLFKSLDHACIYLLIAGTYTPFVLVGMGGSWGWSLFGVVWGLAITGIIFKCIYVNRFQVLTTIIYLLMGWLIIFAIKPFINLVPFGAIMWLLVGGLCYTLGTVFYALDGRYHFFHFLWHLFVLAGSLFQFFAVLFYIV